MNIRSIDGTQDPKVKVARLLSHEEELVFQDMAYQFFSKYTLDPPTDTPTGIKMTGCIGKMQGLMSDLKGSSGGHPLLIKNVFMTALFLNCSGVIFTSSTYYSHEECDKSFVEEYLKRKLKKETISDKIVEDEMKRRSQYPIHPLKKKEFIEIYFVLVRKAIFDELSQGQSEDFKHFLKVRLDSINPDIQFFGMPIADSSEVVTLLLPTKVKAYLSEKGIKLSEFLLISGYELKNGEWKNKYATNFQDKPTPATPTPENVKFMLISREEGTGSTISGTKIRQAVRQALESNDYRLILDWLLEADMTDHDDLHLISEIAATIGKQGHVNETEIYEIYGQLLTRLIAENEEGEEGEEGEDTEGGSKKRPRKGGSKRRPNKSQKRKPNKTQKRRKRRTRRRR